MAKQSYFFSHDFEPTSDPKIQAMLSEYGAAGYGIYWRLIEILHSDEKHKIEKKQYLMLAIAKQMLLPIEQVLKFINDCVSVFELLKEENGFIFSERVLRNINRYDEIINKRKAAGSKGGIANAKQRYSKGIANRSKGKDIKGDEITGKESKEDKKDPPDLDYHFASDKFKMAWADWIEYKKSQHKFEYKTAKTEQAGLNTLWKQSQKNEDDAIEMLETATAKGWMGWVVGTGYNSGNGNSNGFHKPPPAPPPSVKTAGELLALRNAQ